MCVAVYEARGDRGIQEAAPGKTGCPRPATGGSYSTWGGVEDHVSVCMCVHMYRAVYQQLLWGCVPRGLHAQMPPNVQMEGPGPATERSMYLRPAAGDSDSMYIFIIFH